jgi:hypothetical protein
MNQKLEDTVSTGLALVMITSLHLHPPPPHAVSPTREPASFNSSATWSPTEYQTYRLPFRPPERWRGSDAVTITTPPNFAAIGSP